MYCSNCGNEMPEGTVFCPKCGTKVGTNGEANSQGENTFVQPSVTNASGAMNMTNQTCVSKSKKPIIKKWWFWGIIVIIAIIVISTLGGSSEETDSSSLEINDSSKETDSSSLEINDSSKEIDGSVPETNDSDDAELETNASDDAELVENETMSAADIYVWLAEAEKDILDYSVSENSITFIENNPEFFPGSDENRGAISDKVDWEADYAHVAKSPNKYTDKLLSIYGCIVDCQEIETDYGIITYLQISDYDGHSYCMNYLGELEDAFEECQVYVYMLPFGTVTFENTGATYTEAIMGAACYVEVCSSEYEY